MEIYKMLVLSTGHITDETGRALEKRYDHDAWNVHVWQDDFCIYDKEEFGWWINLSDITEAELSSCPEDFAACCRLAMQNDCEWLCLDCDGEVVDCLPTYEWE